MRGWQRVRSAVISLFMALFSLLLFFMGAEGYPVIVGILSLTLTIYGIRLLIYYFTMGRHMVGGRVLLVRGMILFDMGAFSGTLTDVPNAYIMLYLMALHLFSGIVDVLRALEAKRTSGQSWRFKLFTGIADIALVCVCMVFIRSAGLVVYIFAGGLFYSACIRLVQAFRRTAVAYIQ